jgi:hypothetical protein
MAKAKKVSGWKARPLVQAKEDFTNHNGQLYGEWKGILYVVYSYGPHWPLFVYDAKYDVWFENEDKYSPTTTKHRTQTHPLTDTTKLCAQDMRELVWARSFGWGQSDAIAKVQSTLGLAA